MCMAVRLWLTVNDYFEITAKKRKAPESQRLSAMCGGGAASFARVADSSFAPS